MIVTISKGMQITIPANIREELGLDVGSKIEIVKHAGEIIIKPIGETLETAFKKSDNLKPKYHLTAAQMDELIEKRYK